MMSDFARDEFHFVNVARGSIPMGIAIKPCTRNCTDGAIQCSKSGPDIWTIPKETFHQSLSQSFHSHFKLDELETGRRDLLVPNSVVYNSKKRKKAKAHLSSDKSADLYLRTRCWKKKTYA